MVSVKPKVSLKKNNKQNPAKVSKPGKKNKPKELQKNKLKQLQNNKPKRPESNKTKAPKQNNKPIAPKTEQVKQEPEEIKKEVVPKKKVKYVMPSESITEDLVNTCLSALLDVMVPHDKQKNAIFDEEKSIFAEIHCIKIQNTKGNVKFVLPNSTVASTGEVCLITPDIKKGRKHDHEPTIDKWEEALRKEGITEIKTVLPVRQLRVEYDQFELKRRLLTQHDFVMVDTRVLNHVSHLLGKMFFKKHNMLIPVRIDEKNLKTSIQKGLRTAMLRLSEGETSTITVGHTAMPQNKIKENILSLVEQLKTRFPGGEANIRSISIKLPLSLALPLYLTLRPSNTVKPPKLIQKRPKNFRVVEDELSTIPGKKVRVAPDGTVKVQPIKSSKAEKDLDEEEDQEDEESEDNETNDD